MLQEIGELRSDLEDPNMQVPNRVKAQSQNFVIMKGALYKKRLDGLLLRGLSFPDSMEVMKQVHEGGLWSPSSRDKNAMADYDTWLFLANHPN